jgi:transcription elongation factor S-II
MHILHPPTFRANIQSKLRERMGDPLLQLVAERNQSDIDKVVRNIEKSVYNFAIQECTFRKLVKKWDNEAFVQLYLDKLRTVYNNLHSPGVQAGLLSGECLPQQIAFMTHQEYEPEKWQPLIDRKIKRDASKLDNKVGASTAMFTCSRCQSKNCTYYEMQTRSADEPATIFVTCLTCDKHWRI